jgi:hypothetical protein
VYYIGGQYNNKVALDRQAAMYEINEVQSVPTSGGALVVTGVVNEVKSITLEPGRYRFEIKAGTGGNGGSADSNKGGNGGEGQSMNVPVVILKPTLIYYGLGGNGNNGEDSFGVIGKRYPGGGGGGCSGGSAFINIEGYYYFCLGGGGGGDGSNSGSSGSSNSGGYGGYTWGASKGGFGGIGGGSSNAEQFILNDINNRMKIQYQGGGGGGDGGDGGSGLKNTSSGYLRIYQLA